MKTSFVNKTLSTAMLTGLAVLATACGGFETNPLKDSSFDGGKPHNQQPKTEKAYDNTFPPPDLEGQVLNFFEGESNSYVFKTSTTSGAGYRWRAVELPEGASFNAGENGQFVLTWAPRAGTLTKTERCHRDIKLVLALEITSASGKIAELVRPMNGKTYDHYNIALHCNKQEPVIEAVKVASKSVVQGDKVAITIEVMDKGAHKASPPKLVPVNEVGGSAEAAKVNVNGFVSFGAAQGNGDKFVFNGIFDSSNVVIPAGKNQVTARVTFAVLGGSFGESGVGAEEITVIRKGSAEGASTPGSSAKKTDSTKKGTK